MNVKMESIWHGLFFEDCQKMCQFSDRNIRRCVFVIQEIIIIIIIITTNRFLFSNDLL